MNYLILLLFLFCSLAFGEERVCDDHSVINLADRPTFAYGACVMPKETAMLEIGAKHFKLLNAGEANLLPDAEYRFGLGWNTEIDISPPNYISQTISPKTGFGYVSFGIKSLFYHNENLVLTAEGFFIPPSGHYYFGSRGYQGGFNLISLYNWTDQLTMAVVLGAANYGEINEIEFENYKTFSPDLALSYKLRDDLVIYGEFFGQTRSSPTSGFGLTFDTGLIYQIFKFATVDIEFGQRVIGQLNDALHYIGIGSAIKFD
jgi:hypothetical protein